MIDETMIQDMANASVARFLAEDEASRRVAPPTPEEEIAARLSTARFREHMADAALAAGVRPSAIKFVLRDAEQIFVMQDRHLVPRHGETDPGDPLKPLSPMTWLRLLQQSDPNLFIEGQ